MSDGEMGRLHGYRITTWILAALLVIAAIFIGTLLNRSQRACNESSAARDALLYVAYQQEHPRPNALPGATEVDAYDSRYAQWRLRVLEAYERNASKN